MINNTFWNALDNGKDVHYLLDYFPTETEMYFRFAFNRVVYGLSEKSFYNANPDLIPGQFLHVSDAWENIDTLGTDIEMKPSIALLQDMATILFKTSGAKQLITINEQCTALAPIQRKWYIRAILHDLRCGIGVKTVNNVFKEYGLVKIPVFALQLCKKIDVYSENEINRKITFPCSMELKEDGYRMQANISSNNKTTLTSRRGNDRTEDYPEIIRALEELFKGENIILDGEIVAKEGNNPSTFQKLTRKDDKSKRVFVVFDILNDESLPYISRWDNLKSLFSERACSENTYIKLIEHYSANNIQDLQVYYEILNKRKEEGIIIKLDSKVYKRGSRTNMFKCKKVLDADLKIIGWQYGEGKRTNKVATLELQDASKTINVDVGSGIDDVTCEELTKQVSEATMPKFIGKICEINYNEITETGSIRFPRFICIRDDKIEPDDLSKEEVRQ